MAVRVDVPVRVPHGADVTEPRLARSVPPVLAGTEALDRGDGRVRVGEGDDADSRAEEGVGPVGTVVEEEVHHADAGGRFDDVGDAERVRRRVLAVLREQGEELPRVALFVEVDVEDCQGVVGGEGDGVGHHAAKRGRGIVGVGEEGVAVAF